MSRGILFDEATDSVGRCLGLREVAMEHEDMGHRWIHFQPQVVVPQALLLCACVHLLTLVDEDLELANLYQDGS
jgi:hypothetical protein